MSKDMGNSNSKFRSTIEKIMIENELKQRLTKEAYTSKRWFKKEQEKIFSKCWQFAGFIKTLHSLFN